MAADEAVTFYSQALATLGATDSADATPQDAPPPPIAPPAKRIKTHRLLPLAPEDERVRLARRPP